MTKEQAANLPHDRLPGKALAESSSHAETSQQQPGEFPLALSPIDSSSRDLVLTEESLWIRLARQKDAGNTFETRRALRDTYTALAAHYASVGGHEAAVGFLKNALEKADDPQLRHQLARLQGFTIGYDFITTFTHILKSRPYDLKMTLEF